MCGIAGFVQRGWRPDEAPLVLGSMLDAIRHRGPDDQGTWLDPEHGVSLGHRRLSILELSPAGHQPMAGSAGRHVIVFNGEIYNHLELRAVLERSGVRPSWRGHSDTETLVECMQAWGIDRTLQACVGMFALAVWDREEATLTLARDRLGEKPLYYGWQGGAFLFASELKALRPHPAFEGRPDWEQASAFLRLAYLPTPFTVYQGLRKLPAGTCVTLRAPDFAARGMPDPVAYWCLAEAAARAEALPFTGSYHEAVDELERLLRDAVRLQSVADVQVGAFLSGGIDSSAVVALMQQAAGARVTTFSIGMPESGMDESAHAAAVARHLGTEHVAHEIRPAEALELIPRLPAIWDEPFADSSQIPTLLVSGLARRRVTVALSGDGGDELFLGYPQYLVFERLWKMRRLGHLPWNTGLRVASALGGRWLQKPVRGARTVVDAWRQPDTLRLNAYWMDRFRQDALPLRGGAHGASAQGPLRRSPAEATALADAGTYLPDDILVKVDRASMAYSLETRAPLLDHRIVEFALSLPLDYKLRGRTGKSVLRDVLYRHVPRALVDRPKMGFSIPVRRWLRHELRPWAQDLLDGIPADSPVLSKTEVQRIWNEHASGARDRAEQLWPVLTLAAWCRHHRVPL
ncbi:asparagine synthase (glutamine-hydrolyzing) [Ramlibacter sp. USB13]|uniref:asparagine synthase (glutamine-hydrolyzing) n=1 Tax=Ramlibacter cellulosilyticus TaxID=2764187 RepID=A0A923MW79_9BURK|nr:asparagine synthase (glutamine-hydrolyzing) [Ramlibacter cellulosilyticus]MBC5784882.1 asparagine synthase (glutamine-hydrolyzing) [Ramlibacter cellulosilyticus]